MSRISEIVNNMTSFTKGQYTKEETFNELLRLQDDLVKQTFNDEHADAAGLKIWDVENHLEKMNENLGHVADAELFEFKSGCKYVCNEIKARISGNRGEAKVFFHLDNLSIRNIVLKNIELSYGDNKTEIDALVITEKAIYIIEVKNPHRDIFISEEGHYYRIGEFLKYDSNIGEKMEIRESIISSMLAKNGIEHKPIRKIIVFTNDRIEVQNKYKGLTVCFLSQLKHIISNDHNNETIDEYEMLKITSIIDEVRTNDQYVFEFDVNQFKNTYAQLMVKLEEASNPCIEEEDSFEEKTASFIDKIKDKVNDKSIQKMGKSVIAASITAVVVLGFIGKGGR